MEPKSKLRGKSTGRAPQPGMRSTDYRSDFYVVENIIGYTGNLHEKPTVYFQDGTEFGHITQVHSNASNVGRQDVGDVSDLKDVTYWIGNEIKNGLEQAVEYYVFANGSKVHIHTSRNKFNDCRRMKLAQLQSVIAVLSQAIWKHRSLKPRSDAGAMKAKRLR